VSFFQAIASHPWFLSALMLLMFIGSLVLMPLVVVLLPEDYFSRRVRHPALWAEYHPVLRALMLLVKNLSGVVLVLAGITMLVLPGQGVLTILAGLVLLDFPGKFHCERWLIRRTPINRAVNWLRHKSGRSTLLLPDQEPTL